MINRYYGWYKNIGYPNLIPYELSYDLEQWQEVEKKPMMISEYGAGTIAGFHEVGIYMYRKVMAATRMHLFMYYATILGSTYCFH